jgi:hypothetical protein
MARLTFEEWQKSSFCSGLYGGRSIAELAWHARDTEVAALESELAALRALGPCGKHPAMFLIYDNCHHCCQHQETNGKLPHDCTPICTLCAELAELRQQRNDARSEWTAQKTLSATLETELDKMGQGQIELAHELCEAQAGLAALLAPGPCGKHPKIFWEIKKTGAHNLRTGKEIMVAHCSLCAELVLEKAAALNIAANQCDDVPNEARDRILALISPADQKALDVYVAKLRAEINDLQERLDGVCLILDCGHFQANLIGDDWGHFHCSVCREIEKTVADKVRAATDELRQENHRLKLNLVEPTIQHRIAAAVLAESEWWAERIKLIRLGSGNGLSLYEEMRLAANRQAAGGSHDK